jgi:lon-related putative ATP-dependent protease
MTSTAPLTSDRLYRRCQPAELPFKTTAELQDLDHLLGQDRAIEALRFGVGIRQPGYNLYALGASGTGKHSTIERFLGLRARHEPVPQDLCYVNNFDLPHRPLALRLPPGRAVILRDDLARLIDDLRAAIPAAFEGDDYRNRRQQIEETHKQRHEAVFEKLQHEAEAKGITLMRTPMGFAFAPVTEGNAMTPEQFQKLPEAERKRLETDLAALQKELEENLTRFPIWERERRDQVRALNREVTRAAVANNITTLEAGYRDQPSILIYLEALRQDIVENLDAFLPSAPTDGPPTAPVRPGTPTDRFRRYRVNVIVDHTHQTGGPVVYEDNPTMANLVGRVENLAEMGTLVTDFNLIKAGALHRANGGYLIVEALKLLQQPYAWEALKRTIRSGLLRIESPGQMFSMASTITVEPEPVPLDIKVVVIGDRELYYLLSANDPDFPDLFKVQVDFDDSMARNGDTSLAYARLVATIVRREELKPFGQDAVARVIEHASRLADDTERLTMRIGQITDVLREADYWAADGGRELVTAADIEQAIATQRRRADRIRERSLEFIERGIVLIDTDGSKVGQINGLSVLSLGNFAFGRPSRITARVRLGRGEVVDIERQVELGGPLHSKGVLILAAFLGARYASDTPLSLQASLVFEQSYGGVDGDSASSAELYALLSALADLPIDQSFAVTGSVNQHGQAQAIGGVNEKIEGYFDLCSKRGLTGRQGVLIPESNVAHLMLRQDIVAAAAAGKFRIFPVASIDQGIEILTGVAAGERGADGRFPDGSVNARVEARLAEFARRRRAFGVDAAAASGA